MYERSGNMNSVIVSLISVVVSALVSLIGFFITYTSTGKKLEDHKKFLEAKGTSFEETMKLYKKVNVIMIDLANDELNSAVRCVRPLETIITDFKMNEIFVPEKVAEKIKKIIIDFNKYTSVLQDIDDLKSRQSELKLSEQESNGDELNKKSDELFNALSKDYSRLRQEIKTKFTMFD